MRKELADLAIASLLALADYYWPFPVLPFSDTDFKEEARIAPPGSKLIVKCAENIPRMLDRSRMWILWAVFLLVPHIPVAHMHAVES